MPRSPVIPEKHTARRSLRLLLSLFLAIAAATGVSLVVQQPASAAVQPMSSIANCPTNDLCWWVSPNEVDTMIAVRDAVPNWTKQTVAVNVCSTGTWTDCASGLYNKRAGWGAQVYDDPYVAGKDPSTSDPGYCLVPGSQAALNLTSIHYSNEESISLNDSISANRWRSGGC
jgi:hypothetical protein